jgi:hypothetical protein
MLKIVSATMLSTFELVKYPKPVPPTEPEKSEPEDDTPEEPVTGEKPPEEDPKDGDSTEPEDAEGSSEEPPEDDSDDEEPVDNDPMDLDDPKDSGDDLDLPDLDLPPGLSGDGPGTSSDEAPQDPPKEPESNGPSTPDIDPPPGMENEEQPSKTTLGSNSEVNRPNNNAIPEDSEDDSEDDEDGEDSDSDDVSPQNSDGTGDNNPDAEPLDYPPPSDDNPYGDYSSDSDSDNPFGDDEEKSPFDDMTDEEIEQAIKDAASELEDSQEILDTMIDNAKEEMQKPGGDYGDLEAEIYRLESKLSDLEYETNIYENSIILTEECNNLYDEAKCNILKKLYVSTFPLLLLLNALQLFLLNVMPAPPTLPIEIFI